MTKLICVFVFSMLVATAAMGGKNANGSLVVHTDDAYAWTDDICDYADSWVPDNCEALNTRTDKYHHDLPPVLIWFVAAFCEESDPAVTVVYFGVDHNIPPLHHERWGFCGPPGSLEIPDPGWPEFPIAGNSVAFGAPIAGDILFPFYYFSFYGYFDSHYCSAINPTGGYAAYVDDNVPPLMDEITRFGCVEWLEEGYNECPGSPTLTKVTTWGGVKATYR